MEHPHPSMPRKIALLIDGDNISAALLDKILEETSKYGLITIKRIYGDWTRPNMNGWRAPLHDAAARPIQQFQYTAGKNATDCALIIDAMDILYSNRVDGFCLAASDSDYTRLAIRIREEGLFMLGIGRAETPRAFVNACDMFIYTSELGQKESEESHSVEETKSTTSAVNHPPVSTNGNGTGKESVANPTNDPLPLMKEAFNAVVDDNGWATLSRMASQIRIINPRFDVRDYGHKQFSKLIKAHPDSFKMRFRQGRPILVQFIEKESLPETPPPSDNGHGQSNGHSKNGTNPETLTLLKQAFGRAVQEKGWINLELLQSCMKQVSPGFIPEQGGSQALSDLIATYPDLFEIRSGSHGQQQKTYVRVKELTIQ